MTLRTFYAADLYCGAGGTTTGLVAAAQELGVSLDCIAVNHNIHAIATHSLNHPHIRHYCMSVQDVEPKEAIPGGYLDLLWASLECTHHSNARGGKPMSNQSRSSAWDLLRWCTELDVQVIMIENVREFLNWGPLHPSDHPNIKLRDRPIPERKAEYFREFIEKLGALGYEIEHRILNAADYGDPTSRKRLFIQARKSGAMRWPAPTHGQPDKPHRTAREIIDWSIKGKSIFDRKTPLAANTMKRILAGLEKFGGPELEPWLVVFRNNIDSQSVDRPLPTVCTSRGHFGIAQPFLVKYYQGSDAVSVDEPTPTITANYEHLALCEPFLMQMEHTTEGHERRVRSLDETLPTITGSGAFALCEPFLVPNFGEKEGQKPRTHSVDAPLPAVTGHGAGCLVQPFLVGVGGPSGAAEPQSVDEPIGTILAENHRAICQPYLVEYHGGADGEKRTRSLDEPMPTLDCSNRFGLAEPYLINYYGKGAALSIEDPLDTVTGKDRFALCQPETGEKEGVFYLDIRFRMLTSKELAAAMSFPQNYQFQGGHEKAVKQIGNAVPVSIAKQICKAVIGQNGGMYGSCE